jgi:hypothetical protein
VKSPSRARHSAGRELMYFDQAEKVTHWLSGSVPWDAADPEVR